MVEIEELSLKIRFVSGHTTVKFFDSEEDMKMVFYKLTKDFTVW